MEKITYTVPIHTPPNPKSRGESVFPETGVSLLRTARRFCVLMPLIVSLLAVPSFAKEEQKTEKEKSSTELTGEEKEKSSTELTEEEKEMLNDREILENLALLQNLDSIEFLDFLDEMDPEWSKKDETVIPKENEEEGHEK